MLNILRRSPAQKSQDREAGKNYGPGKRDALTGAVNKSAFQKIVEDALAGEHMQGCLLLVDVDHMQEVNDSYGRETGDRVLQAVYATLREHFRGEDGIGRLSEDTFGIWIEGLSADQLGGIRRRIAVVNDRLLHGDSIITKGDANALCDSVPVSQEAIYGKVRFQIPWIGYLLLR